MRISDLSSDVCSSDLKAPQAEAGHRRGAKRDEQEQAARAGKRHRRRRADRAERRAARIEEDKLPARGHPLRRQQPVVHMRDAERSEEHTSELQSLMRISYAVFRLKKKHRHTHTQRTIKNN